MCKNSPLNTLSTIDVEKLEKSAPASKLLARLCRVLEKKMKDAAAPWSTVVCDIAFTGYRDLLAGVQKGTCGRYRVFVDATAVLQILLVVSRLLAHHKVLTDIGPLPPPLSASERPALWILQDLPRVAKEGMREVPRQHGGLRDSAVTSLVERAMYFLFMHEIGHVHERHGDYLDSVLLASPSTRRGLEHRADWFALRKSLCREEDQHTLPIFRLWGFAVGTLFAVLGVVNRNDPNYPSASCRAHLCEGFVSTQMSGLVDEADIKGFVYGTEEARNAWNCVGWPATGPPAIEEVKQAVSDIEQADLELNGGT